LAKALAGKAFARASDRGSQAVTDAAPKWGGLVEFYRSPAFAGYAPTSANVADYATLAAPWRAAIAKAIVGELTPQGALDELATALDSAMATLETAGGTCAPELNDATSAGDWLTAPGAPAAKLPNEKPLGKTVAYDALLTSWQ
jgi:glycerol transport system substrate-binding protein